MLKEFKEFALKGNAMDMAVGIVIGAAFGKIVSSFVSSIINPIAGLLIGNKNLTGLHVVLKNATETSKAVTLDYGILLQNIIDFTIVATFLFLTIKAMNNLRRKEEEAPAPAPAPPREQVLLEEIRDLLKNKP